VKDNYSGNYYETKRACSGLAQSGDLRPNVSSQSVDSGQQYSLGEMMRGGALIRGREKSWPCSFSKGK